MYYYKARYYDPETGRFLQTDPLGYEDQMNLNAYVGNDPVNGIDPSGMCTGSRLTNAEGTCMSTGGFTTDTLGVVQAVHIDQAIGGAASNALKLTTSISDEISIGRKVRNTWNSSGDDGAALILAQGYGRGGPFNEEFYPDSTLPKNAAFLKNRRIITDEGVVLVLPSEWVSHPLRVGGGTFIAKPDWDGKFFAEGARVQHSGTGSAQYNPYGYYVLYSTGRQRISPYTGRPVDIDKSHYPLGGIISPT